MVMVPSAFLLKLRFVLYLLAILGFLNLFLSPFPEVP